MFCEYCVGVASFVFSGGGPNEKEGAYDLQPCACVLQRQQT